MDFSVFLTKLSHGLLGFSRLELQIIQSMCGDMDHIYGALWGFWDPIHF